MRLGDQGTRFLGNRFIGKVFAVVKKRRQDRGEDDRRRPASAERDRLPKGHALRRRTVQGLALRQHPKDEPHGWKFIAVGPDEKLYIPVGQPATTS